MATNLETANEWRLLSHNAIYSAQYPRLRREAPVVFYGYLSGISATELARVYLRGSRDTGRKDKTVSFRIRTPDGMFPDLAFSLTLNCASPSHVNERRLEDIMKELSKGRQNTVGHIGGTVKVLYGEPRSVFVNYISTGSFTAVVKKGMVTELSEYGLTDEQIFL
ncbi:TPA: hypothetical protein HA231_05910 [Candidatus Woesearchaeota archaeon]|nr:hypothetical protein [Candidatus Woesearchaeota archaeon]